MSEEQARELEEYTREIRKNVTDLLTDADNMMKIFADEREKMGNALRKDLEEYNSGIENDVAVLMKDFADEREKMGNALRKDLEEFTAGLEKDVGNLLSDFSTARMETVKELKGVHEEWLKMVKPRFETGVGATEREEVEIEVGETELGELKDKVREIINLAPGGISLTGIGLKLDVEWRKLIRPAKELLDEGKIMKEDLNYYPVKEEEN